MHSKLIAKIKLFSKSPIVLALLIGFLVVLFLPPLIPPHTALYTTREIPPNSLKTYFSEPSNEDSILSLTFVRTHKTGFALDYESVYGNRLRDWMYQYNALSTPSRDWMYIADLDADGQNEVAYLSFDNDTNRLYVASAHNMVINSSVPLPISGELFLNATNYFQRPSDSFLYLSVVSKSVEGKLITTLMRYDYVTDELKTLHQIKSLTYSYMFDGYEDIILFVKNAKPASFEMICYSISNNTEESFTQKRRHQATLKKFDDEMKCSTGESISKSLLWHSSVEGLAYVDIDSLLMSHVLVLNAVMPNKNDDIVRLRYQSNGVVFFIQEDSKHKNRLYKYDRHNKKLTRIKQKGKVRVGSVIFYGDIDDNGVNDIVYTDIRLGHEAICVKQEGAFYDILRFPIVRERLNVDNAFLFQKKMIFNSKGVEHWLNYYSKNPYYYVRWFVYVAIMIFSWFIGFVIIQINENREYRLQEARNKILQLQLENIQKRIDPHFIFNSLNNLGALILEGESNESYDYLSKVSGVLNKALRNRSVLISIEEELNFCTSVLDAQRQRFKDRFDYEVFIEPEIDLHWLMPSNILNSMVDNCIKHGFAGIQYLGMINIELLSRDDGFLIVVEDNGKGREAAQNDKDQSKSTGTGLEICEQYVQLLNTNRKASLLAFKIIDLWNDDSSSKGTRCEYFVPDDLS